MCHAGIYVSLDWRPTSLFGVAGCSRNFRTWLTFLVDFHSAEALLKFCKFKFKILKIRVRVSPKAYEIISYKLVVLCCDFSHPKISSDLVGESLEFAS